MIHEEKLTFLGVYWGKEGTQNIWEDRFRDILDFRAEYGHCNVPRHFKANMGLANWASKQRQKKRKGTLNSEKISRLTEIGFIWDK